MKELIEELQQKLKAQEQNKYQRQTKQVEALTGEIDCLYEALKTLGCYLAGGAITSMFTNKEVNDLDIYFRSLDDLKVFLYLTFNQFHEGHYGVREEDKHLLDNERYLEIEPFDQHSLLCIGYTKKSVMLRTKDSGQDIQLIHCDFYETPEDIFDTFDYTINMGVYDFRNDMFVLDDDFLVDNASRKLTVNPNTAFPIISQLRIDKYKQRGYTINRKEFIKLSLAVSKLNLNSWNDVKEAIGGMYGYTMEEMFDESKDFTYDELFEQLELLEYKLEAQKPFEPVNDSNELIEEIEFLHSDLIEDRQYYYYKKVCKTADSNVFLSHYNKAFKYTVGETVRCENKGVFLYKTYEDASQHDSGDTVIKLTSGNNRAKLQADFGNKFRTNDELVVLGVVDKTTPVPAAPACPVQLKNIPY